MLKIRPKKLYPSSGFTLVEVLVGMLLATIFVAVTMQSMVVGSLLKSRARQYSEGITWIQEDLEKLKYQAATYKYTTLTSEATRNTSAGATDTTPFEIKVNSAPPDQFPADGTGRIRIGSEADIYTIKTNDGKTLTISPNLKTGRTIPANTRVVEVSQCGTTKNTGFAKDFSQQIKKLKPPIFPTPDSISLIDDKDEYKFSKDSNLKQIQVGGGSKNPEGGQLGYTLTRTVEIADVAPYNLLQLKYEVRSSDSPNGEPVAEIYTEIVPNAAFFCPL